MSRTLERIRLQASELWPLPWQIIDDQNIRGLFAEAGALTVCVNIRKPFEVSFYLFDEPFLEQRFADLTEAFRAGYTAFYSITRIPPPYGWQAPPEAELPSFC